MEYDKNSKNEEIFFIHNNKKSFTAREKIVHHSKKIVSHCIVCVVCIFYLVSLESVLFFYNFLHIIFLIIL